MIYIFGGAFDPPHVWHTAIVKSILAKHDPEKIIIIPSSERDDKKYNVSDEHRLAMLEIFAREIDDHRVIIDDYFIKNWVWEMITRDVDEYSQKTYGKNIIHIFWTDTIASMPSWDSEWYAAKVVKKIFVPRSCHREWSEVEYGDPGSWIASPLAMTEQGQVENFELFTDCHIPDISSTELRNIIPDHTWLDKLYEDNPKFIIPWLSKKISQHILKHRLYRPKLEKKPKVLVHVCCGPDVTMPILALRNEYDVICFWYDPNIQPKEEHDRRYDAFVKVCEIESIPYIKWAYDVKHFFTRIKWLELTPEKGEKCTNCYDMRMYVAAKLAKKLKIPYYTSSLNTSPKKDLEKLFTIGHAYAEKFGISFLDIPFRRLWGFGKSVEYTREHDIYRQNYCGCIYSIVDWGESEMRNKIVW
jgi:epoxyqueuosine reductase